jgi:hypothetical protein
LFDLHVVDLSGPVPSLPITISSTTATGEGVRRFFWTPPGDRLVYVAHRDFAVLELYLADSTGATPDVLLSPPFGTGVVEKEALARGGQTVVFSNNEFDIRQIYAVDISGAVPSAPVRISHELTAKAESVVEWELSPDGRFLFYWSAGAADSFSVHVVDLNTFPPTNMHMLTTTAVGYASPGWCFGNDGDAALTMDLDTTVGAMELYYIRDLSAPTFAKISGPLVEGGRVWKCGFPQ